ncbi:LptA/OstA family protein [Phenylobacterium aquaticum]|uniref:LptA/OstA family protein n=1 Tax=Phenylobacterium aquaticum TaxID=1763816 RepID=UPI0026F26186|nr:LptA/OstA family protein [Phenylobacterium aquaticum]
MIELAMMKRWALAAFACGLTLAGPAAAQLAQNSDAPVDITADQLEVVNAQCLAVYTGGAEALQDTVRLRADTLKIYYKPGTGGSARGSSPTGGSCGSLLDRMEATGSVYYVTPQQRVHGDTALYEAGSDTITISGDVVAARGQDVLKGSKLVINVKTGDAQMQSGVKGRNKPGRVRTVLYPKQQSAAATPPAAAR